jgi:hypothetical protein
VYSNPLASMPLIRESCWALASAADEVPRQPGVPLARCLDHRVGALKPRGRLLHLQIAQTFGDLDQPAVEPFDDRCRHEIVLGAEVGGDRGEVGTGLRRDHSGGDTLLLPLFVATVAVSVLLATLLVYSAVRKLTHQEQVVRMYTRVGVPEDKLDYLAVILLAGAAGLILGFFWPMTRSTPASPSWGCVAPSVRWDLLLGSVAGEFVGGVSSGVTGAAEEVGE